MVDVIFLIIEPKLLVKITPKDIKKLDMVDQENILPANQIFYGSDNNVTIQCQPDCNPPLQSNNSATIGTRRYTHMLC